jgi:DNA (cytosine-5)-methyltransferase 1
LLTWLFSKLLMKTFIDLFCGGGIGARGLVNAGMNPVFAVDLWDVACKTYKDNYPSAEVINGRLEEITPPNHLKAGGVDLLIASPECTNHSVAKGGKPRDEKSKETAMLTVQWIDATRPKWFIIENVKEMQSWSRYDELLDKLTNLGYCLSTEILDASLYGAPQARVRMFLIGGLGIQPPKITPPKQKNTQTIRGILDPIGMWRTNPLFIDSRAASTAQKARNAMKALGANSEFLIVYYGSETGGGWQSLDEPLRTITTNDRFALVRKESNRYTIRMLQPSELARAMGLGNKHKFTIGNRGDNVKLCGNGVCAPVMEAIANQLKLVTSQNTNAV